MDATARNTGSGIARRFPSLPRLGLAGKIAAWATVLGSAIVVIVGVYTYRVSVQVLLDREQEGLIAAIDRAANRLDLLLATARNDVTFLSRAPPIGGLMRARAGGGNDLGGAAEDAWKDGLAEIFSALMLARPEYSQVRLIGAAGGGREVVRVDRRDGDVVRAAEAHLQPRGDRPYFKATTALPEGSLYVSTVELNREFDNIETPHRPTLRIATPLFAPSGGVFGIVIVNIEVAQLSTKAGGDLGGGRRLIIANDHGDYLDHPDNSKILGFDRGQVYRLQDDYPDLAAMLVAGDADDDFSGFVASSSGENLACIKRIHFDPANPQRFLVVAAFAARDALLVRIAAQRRSIVTIAVVLIIAGALAAVLMTGMITRPLRRMTEMATSLASGNRSIDLSGLSHRRDETGDLARAFDAMTQQIVRREEALIEQAEALAESAQSFRATVETSPNGLIIVDSEGKIDLVNSEVERLFRYERAELIGQHIEVLVPEELRAHHREVRAHFAAAPSRRAMGSMNPDGNLLGLRKDGTKVPIDVSLSPVEQQGRTMVLAAIVDMTERARFQQELSDRAEELRRSNAELAQFAYVASHDLQEPLRMVSSYLDLLRRRYHGKLNAEADEFIGFAVDGAVRMKRLIDDLLGYARTSNQPINIETVDTTELLSSVVATLALRIEETGAQISRTALPSIQGDSPQLERLFMRLIENALKYRSDAPPRIRISATRQGAFWQFAVTDNGIGIDPSFHDRVFEIFKRLHGRAKYSGTGIGLAVCKMVVERHGGRIWVESAKEGGSVFRFTLPTDPTVKEPA